MAEKPVVRRWVRALPPWLFYPVMAGSLALMGALDLLTGADVVLSVAYLLPVLAVAWVRGFKAGLVFAVMSMMVMFFVDIEVEHRDLHLFQPINALIRLLIFVLVVYLVDRIRKQKQLLEVMALTDGLTGLKNSRAARQGLEEAFERASRSGEALGILSMDADHFKEVNDTLGHAEGDKVLRLVGQVLHTRLRRGDVAARVGGDEFLVLFPSADTSSMAVLLGKLRGHLLEAMKVGNYPVTFSLGAVVFTKLPVSVDAMLKITDEVMYRVKHGGRDGFRIDTWNGGHGKTPKAPAPSKKKSPSRVKKAG